MPRALKIQMQGFRGRWEGGKFVGLCGAPWRSWMGLAGVGWVLEGRARVWERFGKGAEVAQEVLREGLGGSWDGLAGSCGGLGGS